VPTFTTIRRAFRMMFCRMAVDGMALTRFLFRDERFQKFSRDKRG